MICLQKSVHKILSILKENPPQQPTDIILFPPDESGNMSDEESGNEDDDIKIVNHLGKGIFSQIGELVTHHNEDNLEENDDNEYQEAHEGDRVIVPEPQPGPSTSNPLRSNPRRNKAGMSGQRSNQQEQNNDNNDDHQTRPSKRKLTRSTAALKDKPCQKKGKGRPRKQLAFSSLSASEDEEDEYNASKSPLSRMKNKNRQQSKTKNQIGKNSPSFPEAAKFSHDNLPIDPYTLNTPYDYIKLFISDTFVEKVVKETKRYAAKHNYLTFQAKVDDSLIRASHAVMFMTG